jgi:hypothetical protein
MTIRRPRPRLRLRNRRGTILVWFGMTITLILMVTAVVVDYGYWYAAQAELQTAADAAALRGARRLQMSAATGTALDIDVDSVTVNFSPRNVAQGDSVTIDSTQVRLAWWDKQLPGGMPGQPNFDPATWPAVSGGRPNAVVVDNAQQGNRVFGRIFALARPNLGKRAIAWRAYLNAGKCIRPWGVPMSQMLWKVTGGTDSSYRQLTPDEIQTLMSMTEEERTVVMVPPNKTLPPSISLSSLPPFTGEWAGIRFNRDATSTGDQGMNEFERLSAGGCLTSGDAYGVGDFANTDLPAGSLETKMQNAVETGDRGDFPPTCVYATGRADCYADAAARAAGTPGVIINVAYTTSPTASGSEPVQAIMLGQFKIMCLYTNKTDTCGWHPSPFATTGYPEGTLVGFPIAEFFTKLTPDVELGNLPSTSSRLILVR